MRLDFLVRDPNYPVAKKGNAERWENINQDTEAIRSPPSLAFDELSLCVVYACVFRGTILCARVQGLAVLPLLSPAVPHGT